MGRSWNLFRSSSSRTRKPSDDNSSPMLVDGARAEMENPEKHFTVCVGANAKPYVVPLSYVSIPSFRALLDKSVEEFGHTRQGPMVLPCEEEAFEELLSSLKQPQRCKSWVR
ncbi:hypothetical protein LUZ63_006730 [Rhynchospora breviuscula]|uniref:Uncharacterized protein n=1 Tax=Rhynchospora breviuscula TaxID=2022672 RepID=A0A9Q0HUE4_9POAL|nr:hypothetical protein LUZ63_006730 [Rhynchospora breviuscula]